LHAAVESLFANLEWFVKRNKSYGITNFNNWTNKNTKEASILFTVFQRMDNPVDIIREYIKDMLNVEFKEQLYNLWYEADNEEHHTRKKALL
jgi:hypothetical protein